MIHFQILAQAGSSMKIIWAEVKIVEDRMKIVKEK
jgi:hypothetical protein